MIETMKYSPHRFAKLVPEPSAIEQTELTDDIKDHGLREPVVLFEGKILDGRSRQKACHKAGVELRAREFDPKKDGDPLAFVVSKNFVRRQLQMTPSQKAAYVVEHIIPVMKEHENEIFAGRQKSEVPADGEVTPEKKLQKPGKTAIATAAATAAGVSPRIVHRAERVKKEAPAKFEEIKAGKKTVDKAERELSAKQKKAAEYDAALGRIEKVIGGTEVGAGILAAIKRKSRLKKPADVITFAALPPKEMEKVGYLVLVEAAWSLKKAIAFETKGTIKPASTLRDLFHIAATKGFVEFSAEVDGWLVRIDHIGRMKTLGMTTIANRSK